MKIKPLSKRLPIRREWLVIACLYTMALILRGWVLSDNHIFFFFDQARDAIVAEEMWRTRDLKLQGPPASGTNDTLYHGVLYYYLLTGLYAALQSPTLVTFGLAVLNSLSIIPLYFLTKSITKSRFTATLTSWLFVVSFESTQTALWLSNPNLLLLSVSLFFWSLWKIFYDRDQRFWSVLGLSLGLSQQWVVFSAFLFGPLAVSLYYRLIHKQEKWSRYFSGTSLLLFSLTYLGLILSLILTQAVLAYRGIFTLEQLGSATHLSWETAWPRYYTVAELFIKKLRLSTFPPFSLISIGISLMSLWYFCRSKSEYRWFALSWLSSPLWLLLVHPRGAYHALISLELVIYIALAWSVTQLPWFRKSLLKMGGVILLISAGQLWQTIHYRQAHIFLYDVREGTLLKDQLALIERTYEVTKDQPFSISTLTTPYRYNTTWAYLFTWYSRSHGVSAPAFLGSDQTGMPGATLLSTTTQPLASHFAIQELGVGLDTWLIEHFRQEQRGRAGQPHLTESYGQLLLQSFSPQPF